MPFTELCTNAPGVGWAVLVQATTESLAGLSGARNEMKFLGIVRVACGCLPNSPHPLAVLSLLKGTRAAWGNPAINLADLSPTSHSAAHGKVGKVPECRKSARSPLAHDPLMLLISALIP